MQAGGSGFRENVGAYRTGIWSHGRRVAGYSAIGMEAFAYIYIYISMLRNIVHYIIPHMSSETGPTGERYRKVVVFDYGIFPSLPSQLFSPLSCGQREGGREGEGEKENIWVIFYIFRVFLGGSMSISGIGDI